MKRLLVVLVILLISLNLFAEEPQKTPFEVTKEVREKLKEIQSLSEEDYPNKIDSYRRTMEAYIDHKKKACSGEFSILIMEEGKTPETTETKSLSKKERQLCFHELKALQITYVNNMFVARERYLKSIYERQVEDLKKTREEVIKRLQKHYEE